MDKRKERTRYSLNSSLFVCVPSPPFSSPSSLFTCCLFSESGRIPSPCPALRCSLPSSPLSVNRCYGREQKAVNDRRGRVESVFSGAIRIYTSLFSFVVLLSIRNFSKYVWKRPERISSLFHVFFST